MIGAYPIGIQPIGSSAAGGGGDIAGGADTTVPTQAGSLTVSSITTTGFTLAWPSASDDIGVTGYEYRLDSGAWVDVGNVLTTAVTGLTSTTAYTVEVRAYDAAGNRSTPALTTLATTATPPDTATPLPSGSVTLQVSPDATSRRFIGITSNATAGSYTLTGSNGGVIVGPLPFAILSDGFDFTASGLTAGDYTVLLALSGPGGTGQVSGAASFTLTTTPAADTPLTPIVIEKLTTATLDGTGVFDILMRANRAHLEDQFKANRIKGPEYATVYLGSLNAVLQTALEFLLQQQKTGLEAQLLEKQITLAQVQVQKAQAELAILEAGLPKVAAEIAHLTAQTALVNQQKANAILEGTVLVAQECKLRAEFDVLMQSKLKTVQETTLLAQKTATEKAQTIGLGVDADSVIGKQKSLYQAQTEGFTRDAEQKAAKLLVDTWNVRRTTDEATVADATNLLNDATIGRAISKLLGGIGA